MFCVRATRRDGTVDGDVLEDAAASFKAAYNVCLLNTHFSEMGVYIRLMWENNQRPSSS